MHSASVNHSFHNQKFSHTQSNCKMKLLLLVLIYPLTFSNRLAVSHVEPPTVLVFSKTAGYFHHSIPNGIAAIQKLGKENGFSVDTTRDAGYFTPKTLKKYAAVIFLNTTGNLLDENQQQA